MKSPMNLPMDLALGKRPAGRTLMTAEWLLAHRDGGHRLVPRGELVIENGDVIFAGTRFDGEVTRRIDFGSALISPGLVDLDALSDIDTYVLVTDNQPGWAKGRIWPRSYVERGPYEMYGSEELAFQKRFAFGLLLLNGITTAAPIASLYYREWGETVAEFDAAADAAGDLGLRVFLSPAFRSGGMVLEAPGRITPVFDEERGLDGLADAIAFIERQHGRHGGLVNGMLAPDRVETCTLDLLRRAMAAARDLDCRVRLHMAQGPLELETMRTLHGATGPQWMADHGLLSERLIAPHATYASPGDLQLYADHGVSIAHSPLVSARMGSILSSFAACRKLGINIGMATDTAPPDMLMNLLMGLVACRISERAPDAVLSANLFDAATLGGAQSARPHRYRAACSRSQGRRRGIPSRRSPYDPDRRPHHHADTGRLGQGHAGRFRRRATVDAGRTTRGFRHPRGAPAGTTSVRGADREVSRQELATSAGVRAFFPSYPILT